MAQKEIPCYLFVGMLESGKTKFIQETMEDPQFDSGDKTLLLICEEGEEEYDSERFAFGGVTVATIPLIEKNVIASDPAGIIYQNAVQGFQPIVNEIAAELMQNIETTEEAIKVAEVIGENAKKVGIITKIKVGVYKGFQLIWDAAKGVYYYIVGALKGTFDFAKAKAIGIKEYMLWLVNKNEQYDYSL